MCALCGGAGKSHFMGQPVLEKEVDARLSSWAISSLEEVTLRLLNSLFFSALLLPLPYQNLYSHLIPPFWSWKYPYYVSWPYHAIFLISTPT